MMRTPPNRPRPLRLVDTDLTPGWDVTLSVRGVDVPALAPNEGEAQGDDGLVLAGLRMLLPGAWRRKLRRDCLQLVPREFRSLIAKLTPGEMQMLRDRYTAAQVAWMAEASARAMDAASESFAAQRRGTGHSAASNGPVIQQHAEAASASNGMIPIVPGKPMPFWCDGGPIFGAASRRAKGANR